MGSVAVVLLSAGPEVRDPVPIREVRLTELRLALGWGAVAQAHVQPPWREVVTRCLARCLVLSARVVGPAPQEPLELGHQLSTARLEAGRDVDIDVGRQHGSQPLGKKDTQLLP